MPSTRPALAHIALKEDAMRGSDPRIPGSKTGERWANAADVEPKFAVLAMDQTTVQGDALLTIVPGALLTTVGMKACSAATDARRFPISQKPSMVAII